MSRTRTILGDGPATQPADAAPVRPEVTPPRFIGERRSPPPRRRQAPVLPGAKPAVSQEPPESPEVPRFVGEQ